MGMKVQDWPEESKEKDAELIDKLVSQVKKSWMEDFNGFWNSNEHTLRNYIENKI